MQSIAFDCRGSLQLAAGFTDPRLIHDDATSCLGAKVRAVHDMILFVFSGKIINSCSIELISQLI
jgi:hypothetical protein